MAGLLFLAGAGQVMAAQQRQGIPTSTPQADGAIYHIVQSGESLWAISDAYGIPGEDIMTMNGNAPGATDLLIGTILLIRHANTVTPTSNLPPTAIPTTPQPTVFVPSRTPIPSNTPFPSPTATQPPSRQQLMFGDSQKIGIGLVSVSAAGILLVVYFGFIRKAK